MVTFEDDKESEERQKRASDVVIEGLPVGKKSQGDVLDYVVNEFQVSKLETDVRPTAVIRLRNPSHGNGKLKLLVKFKDVGDKNLVLKNCKKTESLSRD